LCKAWGVPCWGKRLQRGVEDSGKGCCRQEKRSVEHGKKIEALITKERTQKKENSAEGSEEKPVPEWARKRKGRTHLKKRYLMRDQRSHDRRRRRGKVWVTRLKKKKQSDTAGDCSKDGKKRRVT